MRLQVSVMSVVCFDLFFDLPFWDVLEVRNPDILQLHSNCIRYCLLPSNLGGTCVFSGAIGRGAARLGSLAALLREKHQMHRFT